MILVFHAYSRGNHGDGLLVDLTLDLIRQAIPAESEIVVVAMDPESFADLPHVVRGPGGEKGTLAKVLGASSIAATLALNAAFGRRVSVPGLRELVNRANLIVGVGGGYMRAGSLQEGVKAAIAHAALAKVASAAPCKSVYLPQSVGPLRGKLGQLIRESLSGVDTIFLRDDRSVSELALSTRSQRVPDLAVMKLLESGLTNDIRPRYDNIYLIARDLNKPAPVLNTYYQRLNDLRALMPDAIPVLQSTARGNNDLAFYRKMKWGDSFQSVSDAIEQRGKGVVVSVRLHGALQSMISGCPSIHLSYERKGFGAYEDLGVPDFVYNALSFDPGVIADQTRGLCQNSDPFWAAVAGSADSVRAARETVKATLAHTYER